MSGTFVGSAILPSLLKQDPGYFYKGTCSRKSRFLHDIATSVICKGDNRRWQPNYWFIIGNLAAGGISNLYYPAQNRNGAALTLDNTFVPAQSAMWFKNFSFASSHPVLPLKTQLNLNIPQCEPTAPTMLWGRRLPKAESRKPLNLVLPASFR